MSVLVHDRQVIYIYLPCLPVRRLIRLHGWPEQGKQLFISVIKGRTGCFICLLRHKRAG